MNLITCDAAWRTMLPRLDGQTPATPGVAQIQNAIAVLDLHEGAIT